MKTIEEELKEKGVFVGKTMGDSMEPMLVEGRDTVMIVPPQFPLKKYDVPVYHRDGHYTMHRILKVTPWGYLICGDNRNHLERDVCDEDIIGVLASFWHNGRWVSCTDIEYIEYAKSAAAQSWKRILKGILRRIFFNKG